MKHLRFTLPAFSIIVMIAVLAYFEQISSLNMYKIANMSHSIKHYLTGLYGSNNTLSHMTYVDDYAFMHAINTTGVYTFTNVCVGYLNTSDSQPSCEIRLYGSSKSATERLRVSGFPNPRLNYWDVTYIRGPAPSHFKWSHGVAYFVVPTFPGNLHHFWEDEFRGLFSTVRSSGRLYGKQDNTIVYPLGLYLHGTQPGSHNFSSFDEMLKTLGMKDYNNPYGFGQFNCFPYGVFGLKDQSRSRDAVNHVLQWFKLSPKNCKKWMVTIVQRTYRRILNTAELLQAARSLGFHSANIVNLEQMTLNEQIEIMACTKILVGVQGAGLQWAMFMETGSYVIEIAWPKHYWHFVYGRYLAKYGIKVVRVYTSEEHVNWPSYELKLRSKKTVGVSERNKMIHSKPKRWDFDNIWKWADVMVNVKNFRSQLLAMPSAIHRSTRSNHTNDQHVL